MFWMLYSFLWVIPWHLNFMCWCFGTLYQIHLHRWFKHVLAVSYNHPQGVLMCKGYLNIWNWNLSTVMVRYIVTILLLYYHTVLTVCVDYKLYKTHIKIKCTQTPEIGWLLFKLVEWLSPVCHQAVFAMIADSEIFRSIHLWLTRRQVAQKCRYVSTALYVTLHFRRPWSLSLIWSGHITDAWKQASNVQCNSSWCKGILRKPKVLQK